MKIQSANLKKSKHGFSLIELIVVVAVVAMLASLFFVSALHRARQQVSEAGCLSNLRHLTLGWQMYVSDNHGVFPSNDDEGGQPPSLTSPLNPQWCPGVVDFGASTAGASTNVAWLKIGQIYPYVGSPLYYRCPADVSTASGVAVYPLGGKGNPRVRSYSMNAWVGTSAEAASGLIGAGGAPYRMYHQTTDVGNPGAANLLLLADENPYSINDSMFTEEPSGVANGHLTANAWFDIPAAWHGGSGGLSFCDGHVQMRLWSNPNLASWVATGELGGVHDLDLAWLIARCTALKLL